MHRTALDGYVVVLGLKKPYTQNALVCLMNFLNDRSRSDEAVLIAKDYLGRYEDLLGESHTFTLDLMSKLGGYLYAARRLVEAQAVYERCLNLLMAQQQPDQKEIARLQYNLANAHDDLGHDEIAIAFYETSLKTRLEVLGPHDPQTADTMANLSLLLYNQGHLQRAVDLLDSSQVTREKSDREKFVLVRDSAMAERWRKELTESIDIDEE